MNAYVVSHNGLGDNLYMIGGLRFLQNFYQNIHYLCKNKYYKDVLPFFENTRITLVPFDESDEDGEIRRILSNQYANNDVLVCGACHKYKHRQKITNSKLINFKPVEKDYNIYFDTITKDSIYGFIEEFYRDMRLNLTYFYDFFEVPQNKESLDLYNSVKNYYIVFMQPKCSDGRALNISNIVNKYIHNKSVILITNEINLYDIENKTEDMEIKYNICKKILTDSKLINYKDIILNSNEIYIIDSAFTGLVLPFLKTNRLRAHKVRIILRDLANDTVL